MTAKKFISSWHKVFNSQNLDNLDDVLADEAVFTSPVVFKPMEGKEMSKLYLHAAGQSFNMEKFSYIREVHDGLHSILEFETYIDDVSVNGVDMIEWNEEGKINEDIRSLLAGNNVFGKTFKYPELTAR